jgi:hypothetical protein
MVRLQGMLVFINSGNCDMTAGFSFMACRYIDVVKSSSGYFKIHDDILHSNVGITVTGLSHCIKTDRIEIYNKLYGMWIKWESNQTGCDSTQWYPHYIDSITVTNCKIHDVNQEGIYGGSTDPSGSALERAVDCYGKHFTPRSAALKDIFIEYDTIYNTGRTNVQLSALSFGKYRVNHNYLRNAGFEVTLTQWPNIWIGGEGEADGEIAYNYCDSASRNNITCYGNHAYIHDNTALHDGFTRDINTGKIYNFTYYSNLSVEIKPTNPYTKTNFKVSNNSFTPTYANVAVYIAGAAKDFTDTGNYVKCSGTVLATDANLNFYKGCAIAADTTYDTVKVACDSLVTVTYDSTMHYDSAGAVKVTHVDTGHITKGHRYYDVYTQKYRLFHLTKDTTITRSYLCSKCALCDSIIIHVGDTTTNYGVFINNGVDVTTQQKIDKGHALDCTTVRYSWDKGKLNYQVSIYKGAGFKVAMTFNWTPFDLHTPTVWPSDTAAVAHYLDSLFAANPNGLPDYLFIANEPSNSDDGAGYVKFLTACVRIAKQYNIPVSIGGSTQDLIFPLNEYYRTNSLTDSTNFLQSVFGTLNPAGISYTNAVNFYTPLFSALPALKLNWWDFHWYENPTNDSTADADAIATSKVFPVLCDWIKKNYGLDAVTDEWDTRNTSSILFNAMASEIRARCRQLMVFYLAAADNSTLAKNNEANFIIYKSGHP